MAAQQITDSASQEHPVYPSMEAPQGIDPPWKRRGTKTTIIHKAKFPTATKISESQQGTEPSDSEADSTARKWAAASQGSGFAKGPPDNDPACFSIPENQPGFDLDESDSSAESKARKKANPTEPDSKPAAKPATSVTTIMKTLCDLGTGFCVKNEK